MATIDTNQITGILQRRLYDASLGVTLALPNVAKVPDRPRLEIVHLANDRRGNTMKGSEVIREPRSLIVTVVTDIGIGLQSSEDIADSVAALFPEGLKLAITGGEITVTAPPQIGPGFRDEAEHRNPVTVRLESVVY